MGGRRKWSGIAFHFIGLLALATAVAYGLSLFKLNPWFNAFLVFAITKVLFDAIAVTLKLRENKYVFFEDYLRETLLFFVVIGFCLGAIATAEYFLEGKVWLPLPAAATVMIWG